MTEEILQQTELRAEERLPWHKPEVQRLTVNLNTRTKASVGDLLKEGSGDDFEIKGQGQFVDL